MDQSTKEIMKDYWNSSPPELVLSILSGEDTTEMAKTPEIRKYLKKIKKHTREYFYYRDIVDSLCSKYNTTPDNLLSVKDKGNDKKRTKPQKLKDRVSELENRVQVLSSSKPQVTTKKEDNTDISKVIATFFTKSDKDEDTQKLIRQLNSSS